MDLRETILTLLTEHPAAAEDVLRVLRDAMLEDVTEMVAGRDNDEYAFHWEAIQLIERAIRVLHTGMTEDELMEKGSTLLVAWDKETQ